MRIRLPELSFHAKIVTLQCLFLTVALMLQILALITVPVTGLSLCEYQGYRFGVFGLCYQDVCTSNQIGYRSPANLIWEFTLPSNARRSISYLLVVHPVSVFFTGIELIAAVVFYFGRSSVIRKLERFILIWAVPTFLSTLMSFLVDLLMFIPHLQWCGWILFGATALIAASGVVFCIVRRTASSRITMEYSKTQSSNDIFLSVLDRTELDEYDDESSNSSSSLSSVRSNLLGQHTLPQAVYPEEDRLQPTVHTRGIDNPPYTLFIDDEDDVTPQITSRRSSTRRPAPTG